MAEGHETLRSDEDVEEILRLAIRNTGPGGGSLRERLTASAEELGIPPEALAEAERQWLASKRSEAELADEIKEKREYRKIQLGDFVTHFATYVAVNLFLLWIDWRGDRDIGWAFWPILGWGIAIVLHGVSVFVHGEEETRAFERWRKKRRRRRD